MVYNHLASLPLIAFKGEFYPSVCNNGISSLFGDGPCPGIVGGQLPVKKLGTVNSPAAVDLSSESHIAILRLGLVVYNYLGSFPLIASF